MSTPHFNEAEIAAAKQAFAEAWLNERALSPFKPDPFRAALTIWNEDNGQLPRALWVAHAAKWQEDPVVLAAIEAADEEAEAEREADKLAEAAKLQTPEFKELVRWEIVEAMRKDMKNLGLEAKDRQGAADRLAKLLNLDEKPKVDEDAGKILGVIQHRLAPMNPNEFAEFAFKQQSELAGDLIELAATDVRTIN